MSKFFCSGQWGVEPRLHRKEVWKYAAFRVCPCHGFELRGIGVVFYRFPEEGNICLGFREFVINRLNNSPSRYIKLDW